MGNDQSRHIRMATRGSDLALWQAHHVRDLLQGRDGNLVVELVIVRTTGDQDQTSRLETFGGVGVFTREVQRAVQDGRADLAVHSLKDLPTQPEPGLTLAAVPERGPRQDAIVLPAGQGKLQSVEELPEKARVATGSPRRRAQLLHLRPDLELVEVRGNVGTRLKKMDDGLCDAMLLAEAGLVRLGLEQRISLVLDPQVFLPAVGQGALGLECRDDDAEVVQLLEELADPTTTAEVTAERTVLSELRAGCHAPLGVWARFDGQHDLVADGVLLDLDGSRRTFVSERGDRREPRSLGVRVAHSLRAMHDEAES